MALGRLVLVRIGRRRIAILPGHTVDLGKVDPDAQLVLSREQGPAGFRYDIDVRPAAPAADASAVPSP
jgi:hypothetical protein